MKKSKVFLLRLSEEDRQMLDTVAELCRRTRSDALRWALYEAAKDMVIGTETAGAGGLSDEEAKQLKSSQQ